MKNWAGLCASAALLVGLSGCDDAANEADESFQVRDADGSTRTTIETPQGGSTLRTGENVPVDLPAGFVIFPDAKVISNTVVKDEETKGAILMMESDATVQEMINFYREKAQAANIEISMDVATKTGKIIGGNRADGLTFSFSAQKSREQSLGQLSFGRRTPAVGVAASSEIRAEE